MAITFVKEGGIRKITRNACIHIQSILHDTQYPVGKVVISPQVISFYKFGMKMGTYDLGRDPFVSFNNGILDFIYPMTPPVFDSRLVGEIFNQCN
jgi:hypothetical protein